MRLRIFTFLVMFLATMSGAVWGQVQRATANAQSEMSTARDVWDWWSDNQTKGTLTLTISTNGVITAVDYDEGISGSASVNEGKVSLTLADWTFGSRYTNDDIFFNKYSWRGEPTSYFNIGWDSNTLTISKKTNSFNQYERTFKVRIKSKNDSWGDSDANILVKFVKGETISKLNVSYTGEGKGERVYNGDALTEEEVKTGLNVTATINGKQTPIPSEDYEVSFVVIG